MIKAISENTENIKYQYFVKNTLLEYVDVDFFYNPAFWFLLNKNRFINKSQFPLNVIDLILNIESNKKDITSINFDKYKRRIFVTLFKTLFNKKSRYFSFNSFINNRHEFLSETVYSTLMKEVKFDEDKWSAFFLTEFYNIENDFLEFIFEISEDEKLREYILNHIYKDIRKLFNVKYPKKEFYGYPSRFKISNDDLVVILDDFISFVEYVLPERYLTLNIGNKEPLSHLFYSKKLEEIKSDFMEQSLVENRNPVSRRSVFDNLLEVRY